MSMRLAGEDLRCPECGLPARLVNSAVIYGGRSYGNAYVCANYPECDCYVGCHGNAEKPSERPKGTLAGPDLREWRKAAHEAFDLPWKSGGAKRREMYAWLADALGMTADECHIGLFDVETCKRVIAVCEVRELKATRKNPDERSEEYPDNMTPEDTYRHLNPEEAQ